MGESRFYTKVANTGLLLFLCVVPGTLCTSGNGFTLLSNINTFKEGTSLFAYN